MMRSTFAGFTTASLALSASHRALEVTGQNIANVNTEGYTRQRLDLRSMYLHGAEFYNSNPNARIGFGVEITGVSQLRDPFLDNQYRSQMAKLGTTDAQVTGYEKLANFLDETDSDGIKNALRELNTQLQYLSVNPNSKEYDSMVRSASQNLLNLFHQNATDLKDVREDLSTEFTDTTVKDANEILKNLAELNETIRNSMILGNPALELKDERNQLIDELASYLPISTVYRDEPLVTVQSAKDGKNMVTKTIEELDIYFTDSTGARHLLVSDNKYGSFDSEGLSGTNKILNQIAGLNQRITELNNDPTGNAAAIDEAKQQRQDLFAQVEHFLNVTENDGAGNTAEGKVVMDADGNITYTTTVNGQPPVDYELVAGGTFSTLEAKNLVGDSMRLSLTDVNGTANEITNTVPEGVMKGTLDILNKSGGFDNPPTDVNGVGYYEQSLDAMVAKFAEVFNELNEDPDGIEYSVLFEPIDSSKPFSVSNIKIADGWANSEYGIRTSKDKVPGAGQGDAVGSTADENVLKMIEALSKNHSFTGEGQSTAFYNGSFYNCFTNMENVLNIDLKAANNTLDNKISVINQTADLRDEISAVSLDEEGINLLHYQQSYSAAARLMTTLDEALDKLINGTGVVGR